MASLLRQIVAGPRARHPEAGLDLCYVTDNIIATSGPSQTYPQRAYRNPLDRLVAFLDSKHGKNWAIWEFRAEGTGYPDHLVYNRVHHYPWPDHHPPPFRLMPLILASMRNWLNGDDIHSETAEGADGRANGLLGRVLDHWKDKKNGRVVVVHCKAGKGRSGTVACSFLIAECGWTPEEALARFTERRMRPKFGAGVSIPSQLRWIAYIERWSKGKKNYVDGELEIVEIHIWGLRTGVKVGVEGFVDEGKKIKTLHTYKKEERLVVEGDAPGSTGFMDALYDMAGFPIGSKTEEEVLNEARQADEQSGTNFTKSATEESPSGTATPAEPADSTDKPKKSHTSKIFPGLSRNSSTGSTSKDKPIRFKSKKETSNTTSASSSSSSLDNADPEPGGRAVIFKSQCPIRVPTNDVNITIERRNRAPSSMGLTMVTAVAHVWFNAFFEGNGPENHGEPANSGVFKIEWDKMDGIKGSSQKGTRAVDRIAVVWRFAKDKKEEDVIEEPRSKEPVPEMKPADWQGGNEEDPGLEKHLGLRLQSADSASVSVASSLNGESIGKGKGKGRESDTDSMAGIKSDLPRRQGSKKLREKSKEEKSGEKMGDEQKLEAYAEKLPNPEGSEGVDGKSK